MRTSSSPSSSPAPTPRQRKFKTCARRCERACCTLATYFPLAFVYSLSTWAVWVEGSIGLDTADTKHVSQPLKATSVLGICLYLLLNTSYTVAVFTDPGSPQKSTTSNTQGKYSVLPTTEPAHSYNDVQTITVSSTGRARYCKKCHTPKPDRTHHCSTCKRCVLKMDHHCPWLATCVGLHNYKAFMLFLIYNSLFCWVCLGSSAWWIWANLFESSQYLEEFAPVNIIMLSVIAGIIGIVLSGFTGWHLYLCIRGQTTIECLEKTRYLTGVRNRVERNRKEQAFSQHHGRRDSEGVAERLQRAGGQILEFHANAVPGASRYEEGEEHASPAASLHDEVGAQRLSNPHNAMHRQPYPESSPPNTHNTPALQSLRRTYSSIEEQRERDRYEEYLDDTESEKLPNAFDLGWRRNLSHLFGPSPWLWALPVCNTTGDGWRWEVSPKWIVASEEASQKKAARHKPSRGRGFGMRGGGGGEGFHDHDYDIEYERDRDLEGGDGEAFGQSPVSMHTLPQARTRPRQKRDFDRSDEGGEVDSFEVSTSDDDDTDEAWDDRRR